MCMMHISAPGAGIVFVVIPVSVVSPLVIIAALPDMLSVEHEAQQIHAGHLRRDQGFPDFPVIREMLADDEQPAHRQL